MSFVKQCSKCAETKPFSEFNKNCRRPDGFAHWCRGCANAANSRYKKANRDKANQYQREWRKANPDKRIEHNEKHKAYLKQHYLDNKEQYRENWRRWVEKNKERHIAYKNQWSKEHGSGHRARAKRFGVKYTSINKSVIFQRDNWTCGLCHEPVERELVWPDPFSATLDHIVPMSRGGDHVESNVHLAHFCCNLLKRDTATV